MSLGEGDTTCDKVTQSVTRRHIASLVLSPFSWEYVTERQAYTGIYIPGKSWFAAGFTDSWVKKLMSGRARGGGD